MPRCPNGSRRNKKTGLCEKKTIKKKCPPGKILNKKTNRCVKNNTINKKKLKLKTTKKKCPPGKILNEKTNRCIKNNTLNKKKIGAHKALPTLNQPLKINLTPHKNANIFTPIFIKNCSNSKIIEDININKITLLNEKSNISKKNYKIMYDKNTELGKIKFLSKGTYGEVHSYSNGKQINIAIKRYFNKKDDEIKVIRLLKKLNVSCEIVNCKLLKQDKNYMAAMDLMNGPLSNIKFYKQSDLNSLSPQNILKVIKTIAKHLQCLNEKNLSYTDLKAANILYKCLPNKQIKIVLGDVGGICKKGQQNASTWLPWEARYLHGFPRCNEQTMVWCLGVVLIELSKLNTDNFYWDNIKNLNQTKILKSIYKACFEVKKLNMQNCKINPELLLKQMLELDLKKRITLKNIINTIN